MGEDEDGQNDSGGMGGPFGGVNPADLADIFAQFHGGGFRGGGFHFHGGGQHPGDFGI